jgi:hypothetical protein
MGPIDRLANAALAIATIAPFIGIGGTCCLMCGGICCPGARKRRNRREALSPQTAASETPEPESTDAS